MYFTTFNVKEKKKHCSHRLLTFTSCRTHAFKHTTRTHYSRRCTNTHFTRISSSFFVLFQYNIYSNVAARWLSPEHEVKYLLFSFPTTRPHFSPFPPSIMEIPASVSLTRSGFVGSRPETFRNDVMQKVFRLLDQSSQECVRLDYCRRRV